MCRLSAEWLCFPSTSDRTGSISLFGAKSEGPYAVDFQCSNRLLATLFFSSLLGQNPFPQVPQLLSVQVP